MRMILAAFLSTPFRVRMHNWIASRSLASTKGIIADFKTVLVMQFGYIFSGSSLSNKRLVMALARPTPSPFPWETSERSSMQVR